MSIFGAFNVKTDVCHFFELFVCVLFCFVSPPTFIAFFAVRQDAPAAGAHPLLYDVGLRVLVLPRPGAHKEIYVSKITLKQ